MLAAILNSDQAVKMSIFIVRAFIRMREMLSSQSKIFRKLDDLERIVGGHDKMLLQVVSAIKRLMMSGEKYKKKRVGFSIYSPRLNRPVEAFST